MVMIKQNILVTHIAAASIYLAPTDLTYPAYRFLFVQNAFLCFPKRNRRSSNAFNR